MSEIKIDLKECLKYMVKLNKEVKRKRKMLYAFCFALVSGIIYFLIAQKTIILVMLAISLSIFLCLLSDLICLKLDANSKQFAQKTNDVIIKKGEG